MIQRTADGYNIKHNNRFYHLTEQWLDEIWHHQVKHRRANVDGRVIQGDQEKAYNRLRYAFFHDASANEILELFVEFRDGLTKNRQNRANLGLKTVTKDGDEDLRAVAAGAPVRPWNAATRPKPEGFDEFIRGQRANRD